MKLRDMFESRWDFGNPAFDRAYDNWRLRSPDDDIEQAGIEDWSTNVIEMLRQKGLLSAGEDVSNELYDQMQQAHADGETEEEFVDSIESQRAPVGEMAEAHGVRAAERPHGFPRSGPGSEKSFNKSRKIKAQSQSMDQPEEPDDFGDEPEDFGGKTVATSFGGEEDDAPDEFKGAPADPMLGGFESDHDDSTFSGEPVFGDVPEPIVDPEAELWHGNVGWQDDDTGTSGPEHRTSVSFPDYEGPKARSSYHPEDKPDEKGFYPRASSKPKSRRR